MPDQEQLDASIAAYYGSHFDEEARITTRSVGGRIEFERVVELVSQRLRPASRVLDVGGATGVHARWLAAAGHAVTLIDPVPEQVAAAARHGGFTAVAGDARRLDVPDASVDAVLLFGPLYHLIERADRLQALREAARVLVPGGVVLAQGISRLTSFIDEALGTGFERLTEADLDILRTGVWTNPGQGFPGGHFHTAAELADELSEAGFGNVGVVGVEGPTAGSLEWFRDEPELERVGLELARRADAAATPRREHALAIANLSPHLLATGTAPQP